MNKNDLHAVNSAVNSEGDEVPRGVATANDVAGGETMGRVISRTVTGQVGFDPSAVPLMGQGRPYPPVIEDKDAYRVDFDGPDDPIKAVNWPLWRKFKVSGTVAVATLMLSGSSAIYAAGEPGVMGRFHVGEVVASLGVSLFVLGIAIGPVFWGPFSELYGRKLPMIISFTLVTCFTFGSAVAKDVQTLMICRFFAGCLGSAPLSVAAAALSDMFETRTRGVALSLFSLAVMGGPMVSPVIGAYIAANPKLGWRWTEYIAGILLALSLVLVLFLQDETYSPTILAWKAKQIRNKTNNWTVYAPIEREEIDLKSLLERQLARPVIMLFTEPILLLISLYNGLVYGVLYMSLSSMPIIFSGYGWKGGNLMLPYLALFIGSVLSNIVNILVFEPKFHRDLERSGKPVVPEARLPFMMAGSIIFSVGIFWLCWTGAYPKHVHWLAPVFGGALYGFGFIALFIPVFNYIIDAYLIYAASALSGNAFLRGAMGTAFPLFAAIMFRNLGIQWAGTLVGCLSLLLMPVPFLFYKYGAWLRSRSRFATNLDDLPAPPQAAAPAAGGDKVKEDVKQDA